MKALLAIALGVLVLTGCASRQASNSLVQQGVTPSGDKTVSVAPARLACSGYQCPVIGVQWSSARAGIAVMTLGVPDQKAEVTGADFYLGSSEVVRVRSRSQTPAAAQAFPVTSFDVPLTLVERLAYTPRSWVKVHTAERSVDENLTTGEQRGKAAEGMAYFMDAVDKVSGRTPSPDAKRGGLFDLLGGERDKDKDRDEGPVK